MFALTLHHYTTRRMRKLATLRRVALALLVVALVILCHQSALAWGWL